MKITQCNEFQYDHLLLYIIENILHPWKHIKEFNNIITMSFKLLTLNIIHFTNNNNEK